MIDCLNAHFICKVRSIVRTYAQKAGSENKYFKMLLHFVYCAAHANTSARKSAFKSNL